MTGPSPATPSQEPRAPSQAAATDGREFAMSEQENLAVVRRFFDEVLNQRKLEAADELFAAEHVAHDPSAPDIIPGPAGQKALAATFQNVFSVTPSPDGDGVTLEDAHWTVDDMIATGDKVVTRWTGRSAQRAARQGTAPTGAHLNVSGIWIHRLDGGRIVESWNVWDTLGMLQQLGVAP